MTRLAEETKSMMVRPPDTISAVRALPLIRSVRPVSFTMSNDGANQMELRDNRSAMESTGRVQDSSVRPTSASNDVPLGSCANSTPT